MAQVREIHVEDIGTSFRVTVYDSEVVVDISSATSMLLNFYKPDKSTVSQVAVHYTDGTDGVLEYITTSNDLDMAGNWKIQAVVTLPTGTWSSDITKFKVYANLI